MLSCPHCKTALTPKKFQPSCSTRVLSTATNDASSTDTSSITRTASGVCAPINFVKVSLFVCPKCGFEKQFLED